jgi:hypothetical protein
MPFVQGLVQAMAAYTDLCGREAWNIKNERLDLWPILTELTLKALGSGDD